MKNFFLNIINTCGSVKSLIYLRILSFTESIFFPVPTDALLAPMVLSGKHNWIHITAIASFWSVLGGIVGYYLGYYLFDLIEPYLYQFNKYDQYILAKSMFETYGIIFLFISANFAKQIFKIIISKKIKLVRNDPLLYSSALILAYIFMRSIFESSFAVFGLDLIIFLTSSIIFDKKLKTK